MMEDDRDRSLVGDDLFDDDTTSTGNQQDRGLIGGLENIFHPGRESEVQPGEGSRDLTDDTGAP
jgi:hypothetical protein